MPPLLCVPAVVKANPRTAIREAHPLGPIARRVGIFPHSIYTAQSRGCRYSESVFVDLSAMRKNPLLSV